MRDLSVLTPPLLTCAVVVIAIVAFLRHELGKKRPDEGEPPAEDAGTPTSKEQAEPGPSTPRQEPGPQRESGRVAAGGTAQHDTEVPGRGHERGGGEL